MELWIRIVDIIDEVFYFIAEVKLPVLLFFFFGTQWPQTNYHSLLIKAKKKKYQHYLNGVGLVQFGFMACQPL